MRPQDLEALLEGVRGGRVGVEEAMTALRELPFADEGFAKVDHHRELRTGFPEVVLGQGTTPGQIAAIANRLLAVHDRVLVTRVSPEAAEFVRINVPDLCYHDVARVLTGGTKPEAASGPVAVVAAGTADLPVAEEAAIVAEWHGLAVTRVYDVGVAGIHRLWRQREVLSAARVLIVVAGMEGALPSVVGGLMSRPVIAVPTSVGYGASFGGLAPLLSMLNSCVAGVAVVNIDNGFGAAVMAAMIAREGHPSQP